MGTVIFVISLGLGSQVSAAMMNARTLLLMCSSEKEKEQFVCEGYLSGVLDYQNLLRNLKATPSIDFCIPDNFRLSQTRTAVSRYLAENRQHDSFSAAAAVTLALNREFPCPKKKR